MTFKSTSGLLFDWKFWTTYNKYVAWMQIYSRWKKLETKKYIIRFLVTDHLIAHYVVYLISSLRVVY